jgi:hypothetical protein
VRLETALTGINLRMIETQQTAEHRMRRTGRGELTPVKTASGVDPGQRSPQHDGKYSADRRISFHSGRGIMNILLKAAVITLAAGLVSLQTGAAEQTGAANISGTALPKAVSALEDSTGGKVLEIRFVDEKGHERFESVVAQPNQVIYLAVNPETEDVTKIAVKELPTWMLNWKLTAYVRSIEKATVPLTKAVTDAEAQARAPAIGAGLAKPLTGANQVLAYNVELLTGGKRSRIAIDATNGARIANPDELYESWTPVKLLRD